MMTYRKSGSGWGRINLEANKGLEKMEKVLVAVKFTPIAKAQAKPTDEELPERLMPNGYINMGELGKIQCIGTEKEIDLHIEAEDDPTKTEAYFIWDITKAEAKAVKELGLNQERELTPLSELWTKLAANNGEVKSICYALDLWEKFQDEPDPRDEKPMETTQLTTEEVIAQHHREITLMLKELPRIPHPEEPRQGVNIERKDIRLLENLTIMQDEIKDDVLQTLTLQRKLGEDWETIGRFGKSQLGLLCNHEAEQERIRSGQEPLDGEISLKALPWATPGKLTELEKQVQAQGGKKTDLTLITPGGLGRITLTIDRAAAIIEQLKYKKISGVATTSWPPTLPKELELPEHPQHRRAILAVETMLEQPEMSYEAEEHNGLDYAEFIRQRTNYKLYDQNISAIPSRDLLFLTKQKLKDMGLNMKKEPEMNQSISAPAQEKSVENKIQTEPSR